MADQPKSKSTPKGSNPEPPDNMALWNSVCETDPATTKRMTYGAKLTAIDAQCQIKRATEAWGPFGGTWSLDDYHYEYIRNAAGEILEITLQAVFRFPGGTFPIAADLKWWTDKKKTMEATDHHKCLATDCITKALSRVGFNSDVFEGKFDDSKYVQSQREKAANGNGKEKTTNGNGDTPCDLKAARENLLVKVAQLRQRCNSSLDHLDFIRVVQRHRGATLVKTTKEVGDLWLAIHLGKYDLDTGDPVPQSGQTTQPELPGAKVKPEPQGAFT